MNELDVVVKQNLGVIDFNFAEIKEGLEGIVLAYKNAVVVEESIPASKKEVAALRKMQKALSDRRIEVKKAFMQPYDDFDAKVKELTALIEQPISLIDNQIKDFEERQKAEKKIKITDLYDQCVGDLAEYLPIDKVYDKKWENKTVSMKEVEAEMCEVMQSVKTAVDTIMAMESDAIAKALEGYKKDLSLNNAITYITNYERQKAEIVRQQEEKRKRDEEERIRAEERNRIANEEKIRAEERQKAIAEMLAIKPVVEPVPVPYVAEDLEAPFTFETLEWTATYQVTGTDDEMAQVEMYMNSIGVEWVRK